MRRDGVGAPHPDGGSVMTRSWRSMVIVDERSYNYYQSDCAANSVYRFMASSTFALHFLLYSRELL
jgi:hypothetical protein